MNTLILILVLLAIGFLVQNVFSRKMKHGTEEEKDNIKAIVETSDATSRKIIVVLIIIIILIIVVNNSDVIKDKLIAH